MFNVRVRDEFTGYDDEMRMVIVPVKGQFIEFVLDRGSERYEVLKSTVLIYPGEEPTVHAEIKVKRIWTKD